MGTREKKPVTFRCEFCSLEVIEAHAPGPMPHYCAACYFDAQRSLNRQRMRRHREVVSGLGAHEWTPTNKDVVVCHHTSG